MKRVNIPASKISTIVGLNPFNKYDDIFEEIKSKITGEKLKTLNDKITLEKNDLLKITKELLPNINIPDKNLNLEHILKLSCKNAVKCNSTQQSHVLENQINRTIQNVIPDNVNIKEIKEFVNKDINLKRGIKNEDKIIQNYNKKYKTTVTDNNSKVFYYPFIEINKNNTTYKFQISAKIDGLENDMLIEIKNRRNKLLNKIPTYEQVQLEIYLRILKLQTGKLIENFNDITKEHIYKSNDELWDNILEKLYDFSQQIIDDL